MLTLLGVLATSLRLHRGGPRALGLRLGDGSSDFLGGRDIALAATQHELKQHRALELLSRAGDLLARSRGGVPLGDDPPGMGDAHPQRDRAYPSLPYQLVGFHRSHFLTFLYRPRHCPGAVSLPRPTCPVY